MKIWLATQNEAEACYNIIQQKKSDLTKIIKEQTWTKYENVYHLDIDSSDLFGLVESLTGEGGGRNKYMGNVLGTFSVTYKKSSYGCYENPVIKKVK